MPTKMILENPKPKRYWSEVDTMAAILLVFILTVVITCFSSCDVAHAMPDYNALADSIRVAEGNPNYGILTHYKHTSYRQACINTCKHAWKDYLNQGGIVRPGAFKTQKTGYLAFLASRYAPIGAKNDPRGLNKNWLKNVQANYKGDI